MAEIFDPTGKEIGYYSDGEPAYTFLDFAVDAAYLLTAGLFIEAPARLANGLAEKVGNAYSELGLTPENMRYSPMML